MRGIAAERADLLDPTYVTFQDLILAEATMSRNNLRRPRESGDPGRSIGHE
jgi:hypothetical protein